MTSQYQDLDAELVEAIDKILQKSFEDSRKKLLSLIARREKKILRENKQKKATVDYRGGEKREQNRHDRHDKHDHVDRHDRHRYSSSDSD